MVHKRVIPVLLLKDNLLYKTVKFRHPKYVGDPINAVRIFNSKEVDELIIIDIEAANRKSGLQFDLLKDIVSEAFMPVAYGGGVTTLDEIEQLLRIGIEKIVINAAAFHPGFLQQATTRFGSSTIVWGINVKRKGLLNKPHAFNSKTQEYSADSLEEFIQKGISAQPGEIFLYDVDREGTFKGLDTPLFGKIAAQINTPLIACGGAKNADDVVNLLKTTDAGAVAIGSMAVFLNNDQNSVLINYPVKGFFKTH